MMMIKRWWYCHNWWLWMVAMKKVNIWKRNIHRRKLVNLSSFLLTSTVIGKRNVYTKYLLRVSHFYPLTFEKSYKRRFSVTFWKQSVSFSNESASKILNLVASFHSSSSLFFLLELIHFNPFQTFPFFAWFLDSKNEKILLTISFHISHDLIIQVFTVMFHLCIIIQIFHRDFWWPSYKSQTLFSLFDIMV
jgi:hypothetical protein